MQITVLVFDGYKLYRCDYTSRRSGGVAAYMHNRVTASVRASPGDSPQLKVFWLRVSDEQFCVFVGAVYHPPRSLYESSALFAITEANVNDLTAKFPLAVVILAGDFNTLDDADVSLSSVLHSVVDRPMRGVNFWDRIYVSSPCYATAEAVESTVRINHKVLSSILDNTTAD